MSWDKIITEPCVVKLGETSDCSGDVSPPGPDPRCTDPVFRAAHPELCEDIDDRCNDPAFRLAHPELCEGTQVLILKPGLITLCTPLGVQFRTFVYANNVEMEVSAGVTYGSSDLNVVQIGAVSGKASAMGAGMCTVSVKWQDLTAFAQVTVIDGDVCCDGTKVGMLVLLDNSASMKRTFGFPFGNRVNYAKILANNFLGTINATKDVGALMTFNESGELVQGFTNDIATLKNLASAVTTTNLGTDLFDALTDAVNYVNSDNSLTQKVIILITDADNHGLMDPRVIADAFVSSGGILVVVGIRAFGANYDTINLMASGGYFLNAIPSNADDIFPMLSGLKGYYCAGNCVPPGDIVVPRAQLDYFGFTKWDVTAGAVDLIGGEPPYDLFDLVPGHGLYVDLTGSGLYAGEILGTMATKNPISFISGTTYRLKFKMAGNNRVTGAPFTVQVKVGALLQQDITINNFQQPFTDYEFDFTPGSNVSAKISFQQTVTATSNKPIPAPVGLLLDDVQLIQDPAGANTTLFTDNFNEENALYIPPDCGMGTIVQPGGGFGYGYDCYGTGCLEEPVAAQGPDPVPQADTFEDSTNTGGGSGGGGGGGGGPTGGCDCPSKSYIDNRDTEVLAEAKSYADSLEEGDVEAAEGFVEVVGDTMTGPLIMEGTYIGFSETDGEAVDLRIYRDSAHSLALKDGANANDLRIYNTEVGVDYERLFVGWSAGTAVIRTQASGAGMVVGDLELNGIVTIESDKMALSGSLNFVGTDHAGLHLNRLTTAQKNALIPSEGMLLYDTTIDGVQSYQNGAWITLGAGAVTSVNGEVGVVVLDTGDVAEGSNLYFTNARALSATAATYVDVAGDAMTGLLVLSADPAVALGAATKQYVDNSISGFSAAPFVDTTAIVKGSVTASKLLRFEVDGFTAATTRVITPPDADITLAGQNYANTWSATQTFSAHALFSVDGTYDIGAAGVSRPRNVYVTGTVSAGSSFLAGTGLYLNPAGYLLSAGNGIWTLSNTTADNVNRLQLGGTTSSFPSIKRNGAGIDFRLADDSDYTAIAALSIILTSGAGAGKVLTSDGSGVATWQAPSGANPFDDGTAIIKGSADATKLLRFEVDGFTTSTTRVITPPNADINLPGTNITNTWALAQTFSSQILLPDGSAAVPALSFSGASSSGFYNAGSGQVALSMSGTPRYYFSTSGLQIDSAYYLGFGTIGSPDTILLRDAANTIAFRNGANAQALRIYNTYIDGSNYARGNLYWSGDYFRIAAETLGTGTSNGIIVSGGNGIYLDASSLSFRSANGATYFWYFSSGHFLAGTDNTYDIGASGATRPRNVYVAGGIFTTGVTASSSIVGANFFGGNILGGVGAIVGWSGGSYMWSSSDGVIKFTNAAVADFSRLQLGGTTSAFPAIKRNGAGIDFRVADDSAYAAIAALSITLTAGAGAGKVLTSGAGGVATWETPTAGSSPPFADTTAIVMGSATSSKLLRFEIDGFTAATTRVITPPNADITLAGINIAQTWASDQTFSGVLLASDGSVSNAAFAFSGDPDTGLYRNSSNIISVTAGGTERMRIGLSGVLIGPVFSMGSAAGSVGFTLGWEADHILQLRNSTNPQSFRIYERLTSASDYSRLTFQAAAGNHLIQTQAETQTLRILQVGTGPVNGSNVAGVDVIFHSGQPTGNAAPGAILFQLGLPAGSSGSSVTALATVWKISPAGHLLAGTDGTYDLGAAGATRPRNGFFSLALNVGTDLSIGRYGLVAAGTSGNNAAIGGLLYTDSSSIGNATTSETDAFDHDLPANTLSDNGSAVVFRAAGTFATSLNTKQIKLKFGGTTVFDSGALVANSGGNWVLTGTITRTGATTQKCEATLSTSGATTANYAGYAAAAETLSGAVTIKLTFTGTANDDIVGQMYRETFQPVAP